MPATAPDAALAADAPQTFLRDIQARAWRYAWLTGAADRVPERLVGQAMQRFCRHRRGRPPTRWPLLFWAGMVDLAGQAAPAAAGRRGGDPLDRALLALPLAQRHCLLLRVWLGFEPADIARLLHLPTDQVRRLLVQAIASLRTSWQPGTAPEAWPRACRDRLEQAAAALPATTTARLDHARAQASGRRPWGLQRPGRRAAGAGLALAGLLLLVMLLPIGPPAPGPEAVDPPLPRTGLSEPLAIPAEPVEQLLSLPADDFALLASPDEFTLLAELELLLWLHETTGPDDAAR